MYNLINNLTGQIITENVDIDLEIKNILNYAYALNGSDKRYVEVNLEPVKLNIIPDYYPI